MGLLVAAAVRITIVLLMISMGLRMGRRSFLLLWRNPALLVKSIAAAFLIVPAFTYLVIQIIPLSTAQAAGLWLIAIAPGAPMIQNAASRRAIGDPELAASFQVAAALLVIAFAPLWLLVMSALTGSELRMHPLAVARQVSQVQLIPVLLGLVIHERWPRPAERAGDFIRKFGYIALMALFVLIFVLFLGRIIRSLSGWEIVAAAMVAVCAIAAGHLLAGQDLATRATIANADAQRNIGLALAIATWNLPDQRGAVALVLVLYTLIATIAIAAYVTICQSRMA